MRDSTLNLIAISVFSFTMLSLLGPMLSLSPAVPAVAVAGLLGLATLDQLGLEGRMGNIVVDWAAWTSAEHRQRVLRHEAGHFLVASLLEIPVVGYTLNTWEAWKQGLPGQGGVVFDTAALEQTFAQGQIPATMVDRYCRVWMAGIAAEQITYGDAQGGFDDRQKFAQLWQQMDRPAAEAQLKQRWAVLQAKTLLQANQAAFEQLVEAMDQRQPVAVCQQIIQQHGTRAEAA
ncbi:MAG: ATP-dependent Zn protease [Cyanobacteria bacterium Co-bin8]|nr:ATP-dependent Zn protease [Cyanobacteria bacterium Co-bin8]